MKKTDIEQVKEIIANSGNNFHCRVLGRLKEKGWGVLISPYYNDNVSDKPREIDLIAEKAFDIKRLNGDFIGTVNVKLFIECKYIPQKIVFWFYNKDRVKAEHLVLKTTSLKEINIHTKDHHYLRNDSVAKLFADEKKQKTENEIFYKALTQSLNSLVYYRGSKSVIPQNTQFIKSTVNYPVIICNDFNNLYRVDIGSSDEPAIINDNFQLEVNYAYLDLSNKHSNEYFLIDIVSYDKIDAFLDDLQTDVNIVGFFLQHTGLLSKT
jgi:hypothetical protein